MEESYIKIKNILIMNIFELSEKKKKKSVEMCPSIDIYHVNS